MVQRVPSHSRGDDREQPPVPLYLVDELHVFNAGQMGWDPWAWSRCRLELICLHNWLWNGTYFKLHIWCCVLTRTKCLQCLTEDGKALTQVCIIDIATSKVVWLINSSNHQVQPQTISPRYTHNLWLYVSTPFFHTLTPDFSFSGHNSSIGSSSQAYYNDTGRHTGNANNTINDPALSLVGIGLTCFAALTPMVH